LCLRLPRPRLLIVSASLGARLRCHIATPRRHPHLHLSWALLVW
jgi:hypothetical protein